MELFLSYISSGMIVLLFLILIIGLIAAIRKFAPKSVISEVSIRLLEGLYKTIDEELEKALVENRTANSNEIALIVFLNIKKIYKDRLDDIVDAFAFNINLPDKTKRVVNESKDPESGDIYNTVDRLIFSVIEDRLEARML